MRTPLISIAATTERAENDTLGVPLLSQQIAASKVLGSIERATPEQVKVWTAQVRSFTLDEGLPTILDNAAPQTVVAPDQAVTSERLQVASESVVKITGTAFQCGQIIFQVLSVCFQSDGLLY